MLTLKLKFRMQLFGFFRHSREKEELEELQEGGGDAPGGVAQVVEHLPN
jgi:hypothetical protein